MRLGRFTLRLVCRPVLPGLLGVFISVLLLRAMDCCLFLLDVPRRAYSLWTAVCVLVARRDGATFYTMYARLFSAKKKRGMILIERLCGERESKFRLFRKQVSQVSQSTLTARVDFQFVDVSLVWLMTLFPQKMCCVCCYTRVMLLVKKL
jgi:hypothetical protein